MAEFTEPYRNGLKLLFNIQIQANESMPVLWLLNHQPAEILVIPYGSERNIRNRPHGWLSVLSQFANPIIATISAGQSAEQENANYCRQSDPPAFTATLLK